jgi:DNA-binding NarL/FixJ family response regulator
MTRLVLVDDSVESLGAVDAIRQDLGWEVVTTKDPGDLPALLGAEPPFDVAMIDLSFAKSPRNGLDALLAVHEYTSSCRLVVYTQADGPVADLLRDAWDAFPLATALSKRMPLTDVLRCLSQAAIHGSAPVDPFLQPQLPAFRSPWRSVEGYADLVPHAGHAKLWQALIDLDHEPSYKELAEHTGLKLNTVRNYRSELLERLADHHLDLPKMREMQAFAKRCRALLEPHIRRKLSKPNDHGEPPGGGA